MSVLRQAEVAVTVAVAALTVLVSAAPRLALAAGTLPDAGRPFIWSDVLVTYLDHLAGGRLPYRDTFFDYPPGIGYPAGAFALATTGPLGYVALWTATTAVAAGAIAFMLARTGGTARTLLYWSLSPQLLLLGAVNFDVFAIALLLGAVLLARTGRRLATLGLLALGAVTKVFPVALVPLELDRTRQERGWTSVLVGVAVFAAVTMLVLLPSLVAPWPSTLSFLNAAGRTNFDSPWGIVLAGLDGIGVPRAGEVVGIISIAGLALTYVLGVMPRARRAADPAQGALLALLAVLFWSRLYSPQFSLWLLPFFALLGIGLRRYALLSLADVIVFATAYPLTLIPWERDDPRPVLLLGVLAAGVVLRHLALILVWRDVSGRAGAHRGLEGASRGGRQPRPPGSVERRDGTDPLGRR